VGGHRLRLESQRGRPITRRQPSRTAAWLPVMQQQASVGSTGGFGTASSAIALNALSSVDMSSFRRAWLRCLRGVSGNQLASVALLCLAQTILPFMCENMSDPGSQSIMYVGRRVLGGGCVHPRPWHTALHRTHCTCIPITPWGPRL
jgi:hypothetical protein